MAGDDAPVRSAVDPGRHDVVFLPHRDQPAAHHARKVRPADQREDDREGEEGLDTRPIVREGRRECDPQRQLGQADDELDDALDD